MQRRGPPTLRRYDIVNAVRRSLAGPKAPKRINKTIRFAAYYLKVYLSYEYLQLPRQYCLGFCYQELYSMSLYEIEH